MQADLLDILQSLAALIEEENALLGRPGARAELAELVTAKTRLAAELQARLARLERERPDWRETLDDDMAGSLAAAAATLAARTEVNADLLARQIELAEDVIDAIGNDVRRRRGTRAQGYGARGTLTSTDQPNPIAVNASL